MRKTLPVALLLALTVSGMLSSGVGASILPPFGMPVPKIAEPAAPKVPTMSLADACGIADLAFLAAAQKDYIQAVALYTMALPVVREQAGAGSKLYASMLCELSTCFVQLGAWLRAEETCDDALAAAAKCEYFPDDDLAIMYSNGGAIKAHLQKYATAETYFQRAIALTAAGDPISRRIAAVARINYADMEAERGRYDEALSQYKRGLAEYRAEGPGAQVIIRDVAQKMRIVRARIHANLPKRSPLSSTRPVHQAR